MHMIPSGVSDLFGDVVVTKTPGWDQLGPGLILNQRQRPLN